MLVLAPEDVSFCFVKSPSFDLLMGIKYRNWFFGFDKFLNLDLKMVKEKYRTWSEEAEERRQLRAIVEKDAGIYLCIQLEELSLVPFSEGMVKLAEKMLNSQGLKSSYYHQSWRRSRECFLGKEAVNWIVNNYNISRLEAVRLGQKCLEKDLFVHVLEQAIFKDDDKEFYFFKKNSQIKRKNKHFILNDI